MTDHPNYGRIDGHIVIIGLGSIGKGTLPLIQRHFDYDPDKLSVIEPNPAAADFLAEQGITHHQIALNRDQFFA